MGETLDPDGIEIAGLDRSDVEIVGEVEAEPATTEDVTTDVGIISVPPTGMLELIDTDWEAKEGNVADTGVNEGPPFTLPEVIEIDPVLEVNMLDMEINDVPLIEDVLGVYTNDVGLTEMVGLPEMIPVSEVDILGVDITDVPLIEMLGLAEAPDIEMLGVKVPVEDVAPDVDKTIERLGLWVSKLPEVKEPPVVVKLDPEGSKLDAIDESIGALEDEKISVTVERDDTS